MLGLVELGGGVELRKKMGCSPEGGVLLGQHHPQSHIGGIGVEQKGLLGKGTWGSMFGQRVIRRSSKDASALGVLVKGWVPRPLSCNKSIRGWSAQEENLGMNWR